MSMQIQLNERNVNVEPGETLFNVRDQFKHDADILILNGFPTSQDTALADADRVVLIRRGELPEAAELEAQLMARSSPGVYEIIHNATVGIAGVGGLGSSIAVALARTGVGRLILADYDVVEPSNLNRQQYFIDQIGLPKVDALKANLARINPNVQTAVFYGKLDRENIPQVFSPIDILVEAFDAPDQKALLVGAFRKHYPDKPVVAGSGMAGYGSANSVVTRCVGKNFYLCGDGESAAAPGNGLMAPRVGIAAHHQANAVLRLLLGEEP
jgi:sulfur carrier protein ThiS adenylyltransferase